MDGLAFTKFFRKRSWEGVRIVTSEWEVKLTELVFRARLELFVGHQLFYASSNGLDVVDDQLVEIGVLFAALNEEPIAKTLACDVCVWFGHI